MLRVSLFSIVTIHEMYSTKTEVILNVICFLKIIAILIEKIQKKNDNIKKHLFSFLRL